MLMCGLALLSVVFIPRVRSQKFSMYLNIKLNHLKKSYNLKYEQPLT